MKLYGTQSAKGDHCPDLGRPHRLSKILKVPERIEAVALEQLDALISTMEATQPSVVQESKSQNRPSEAYVGGGSIRPIRSTPTSRRAWDLTKVQEFIDRHLVECKPGPAMPYDGGFKWVLGSCPFNSDHNNRSAVIVIKQDGTLGFKCHHDGCKGNNWRALRARFEPKSGTQDDHEGSMVLDVPGDEDLVARFGPPVTMNKFGEPAHVNQMFVAAKFARDNLILHEPTLNMVYVYDPDTGLWRPKTEASLIVEVGESLRDMLNECGGGQLLGTRTENLVAQIVCFLKGMVERPDVFQQTRHVIHVGNGVLHMDDDLPTLHLFSPDYYSRNRSEICFDAKAECPRFLNELLLPALPDEDIALLQRYAGQCLIGQNLTQKILLLRGTPAGGKSTLVNILETVIGVHNVAQLRVQLLTERFEIAGFVGKTLLSGKDVPGDFLNNKAAYVLKALVGGDRLNAEQKNVKHRFEVMGEFNAIITSNSRLHVRLDTDTGAWRRRLLIIDYERPPVEKAIPQFDRQLVSVEGPGILNWCIEGARKWLAELKVCSSMQMTPAQIDRVETLLSESDSVRQFVVKCVVKGPGGDVTVHELLTGYNKFCDERGWQAVTVRCFENHISDVMMEIHRVAKRTDIKRNDKNQRGFAHVCLQDG
ncbi:MAG: phage/plasmid primase, P4 family [Verrucomicrobiia bacterium]